MHVLIRQSEPISPRQLAGRRGGFTFLEVLFAVIILGIGFIMLAGMFPVAIQQQQASVDDSYAPAIGAGAASQLAAIFRGDPKLADPTNSLKTTGSSPSQLPKFSRFGTGTDVLSQWVAGLQIVGADPGYGWGAVYSRDLDPNTNKASTAARVIIVTARARVTQAYTISDTYSGASLDLQSLTATITAGNPDTVKFNTADPASASVATGAWIIVGDDRMTGVANGFFFQIGNQRLDIAADGTMWELVPGKDLSSFPTSGSTTIASLNSVGVFMLGRGIDPNTGKRSGPAQDLGIFSAVIPLPPPP